MPADWRILDFLRFRVVASAARSDSVLPGRPRGSIPSGLRRASLRAFSLSWCSFRLPANSFADVAPCSRVIGPPASALERRHCEAGRRAAAARSLHRFLVMLLSGSVVHAGCCRFAPVLRRLVTSAACPRCSEGGGSPMPCQMGAASGRVGFRSKERKVNNCS